jgi:L-ascorbate metabolism protein UlaG (beta-lactamase superfamily)
MQFREMISGNSLSIFQAADFLLCLGNSGFPPFFRPKKAGRRVAFCPDPRYKLNSKFFQKAMQLKKTLSRRKFLYFAGAGTATTVASLQATQNLGARFISERLEDIGKPSISSRHKPSPADWDSNRITAAWLGHATVLMNFYGLNIITDPVLFSRVGADIGIGTVGPKRRQSCALTKRELPHIDLVLLSHAHMDHIDIPSLQALPGHPKAVTAYRTSDLLNDTHTKERTELKWGEKALVRTENGDIEVEAFQVRHWGARWRHDTYRGYNGYILSRMGKKVIFGGDTAMCDGFKEISGKGPFEFACMPIGAYNPFINAHCNPEEAVQMANAAGAKYILPMHHFTFRFGREASTEPIHRFEQALGSEKERVALKEAGQTFVMPA